MTQTHEDAVSALKDRILSTDRSDDVVRTDLATSQRIIARVTDGIYREPWAAFRELIANAYDADATRVIVDTGAPDFQQVSVRDDGHGMNAETLAYVLKSIGGSSKRTSLGARLNTASATDRDKSPKFNRPLIGKIGIGLFAVAQLTQHFQIITKAKGETYKLSATVKLRTHDDSRGKDVDEEFVAGEVLITREGVSQEEVDNHGTTIVLYSLRREIQRILKSAIRWQVTADTLGPDMKPVRAEPIYHIGTLPGDSIGRDDGVEPHLPWNADDSPVEKFRKLVDAASQSSGKSKAPANFEHFDEYLKLMWSLSMALPLEYLDGHPFDIRSDSGIDVYWYERKSRKVDRVAPFDGAIRDHFELSARPPSSAEFSVFVDDIELRRPILLPSHLRRASRLKAPMMMVGSVSEAFSVKDIDRAGGQLSFEAYLYWNSAIAPKENQGVILRVREASGALFDKSFLNYQISEQNRLSQITAEIFVKDGLDGAINIDRESFNFSHPHFLYIQKWLHGALRAFINRNKQIGSEDLKAERRTEYQAGQAAVIGSAMSVWSARRGGDSDPPIDASIGPDVVAAMPSEVGGSSLDWSTWKDPNEGPSVQAVAFAVILEAYGLLNQLEERDRVQLIEDLISAIRVSR